MIEYASAVPPVPVSVAAIFSIVFGAIFLALLSTDPEPTTPAAAAVFLSGVAALVAGLLGLVVSTKERANAAALGFP